MISIASSIKTLTKSILAIFEYFSLKNQTLWSSSTQWSSGTKTIPNISKYRTIRVYAWGNLPGIVCERIGSYFKGEGLVPMVSAENVHTSCGYTLKVEGDNVTISYNIAVHHNGGAQHGQYWTGFIVKIVGEDPLLPDVLSTFAGGVQTNLAKVWRWHLCYL